MINIYFHLLFRLLPVQEVEIPLPSDEITEDAIPNLSMISRLGQEHT